MSEKDSKNRHMAAIGKKGGKIGGPSRARKLSARRRSQIAIEGAEAKWRGKRGKKEAEKLSRQTTARNKREAKKKLLQKSEVGDNLGN